MQQSGWKSTVIPALSKNTSIVELDTETPISVETARILNRNSLLVAVEHCHQNGGSPSLPVWPRALERLGGSQVEPSALYQFLCNKAADFPEHPYLVGLKRMAQMMQELKQESLELEQKNKRLRQENEALKTRQQVS